MIKRTYFISTVCYKGDGTGSFSYYNNTAVVKSLMPCSPALIQKEMLKPAEKLFKEKGLDTKNIHIIAFNRV